MAVRGGSTAAENYTEPDWETAVPKAPSDMQVRFDEWLREKAGEEIESAFKIDLDKKQQLSAFQAGIILGTRFRMKFQASPENQEASASEEEAPAPVAKKAAKKGKAAPVEEEDEPAPKAKAKKGAKAKAAPVVEDDDDEDEAPAPKAKASAKASKGKRGGKAAF